MVVLLLLNPHVGTKLWILQVFCDNESASPAFAVQLNKCETNVVFYAVQKK